MNGLNKGLIVNFESHLDGFQFENLINNEQVETRETTAAINIRL